MKNNKETPLSNEDIKIIEKILSKYDVSEVGTIPMMQISLDLREGFKMKNKQFQEKVEKLKEEIKELGGKMRIFIDKKNVNEKINKIFGDFKEVEK